MEQTGWIAPGRGGASRDDGWAAFNRVGITGRRMATLHAELAAVLPAPLPLPADGGGEAAIDLFWQGHAAAAGEPALLLDRAGQAIRVMPALEQLLHRHDGLTLRAGRPAATDAKSQARLAAILAAALDPQRARIGSARIDRPTGRAPLVVTVRPLAGDAVARFAIMAVIDPLDRPSQPRILWQQAFGLTAREGELAELLMAGHSIDSASAMRGRSPTTLRVHLRHLFDKVGVSRQSDLIALLGRVR